MSKKLIILFSLIICLAIPAPMCLAEETDKKTSEITVSLNEELINYSKLALEQMNLDLKHLTVVKDLYRSGKYVEALQAYKPIFFDNIQKMAEAGLRKPVGTATMKYADDLLENYVNRNDDSGLVHRIYMGEDGKWNWYPGNIAFDTYGLRFEFMEQLIYAYQQTAEVKYLRKAISIWEDFDSNWLKQYNAKHNVSRYNEFGRNIEFDLVGQLYTGGRIFMRVDMLLAAVKVDRDVLYNEFSDIAFAKMLYFMPLDTSKIQLVTTTPNTFTYAINALITASETFGDFKPVIKRYDEGVDALKEFLLNQYLQDGGDQELSFHYNYELPSLASAVVRMYDAVGKAPDWLENIKSAGLGRVRMLASVVTPIGEYPSIAKDYEAENVESKLTSAINAVGTDSVSESVLNYVFGDKSKKPPAFNSIAFPYAGYYVMRQNWEPDSHYMFMMGSRFGAGHTEANKLEVQYTAFGERLLTSSSDSYSTTEEHELYNNHIKSTLGNNTISVDGLSQRRVANQWSDFSTPHSGIWYTSDNFDLAESTYSDGYNTWIGEWDERKTKEVSDVTHTRRTIFDKENGVGIVIDNLEASRNHTYQLNWNFAKKFNAYDSIAADADKKWIKTCLDDSKGGVELYNFYDGELGYEIYVGENGDEGIKGWYLEKYGTNFKPAVHTETVFSGEGNQIITTLINPTYNNKSKIKKIEENGEGFSALLENGNIITLVAGKEKKNDIVYENLSMKARFLYAVKSADGSIKGIAINASSVNVGKSAVETPKNFEFILNDGELAVISEMNVPTQFEWVESEDGVIPNYGYGMNYKFMY